MPLGYRAFAWDWTVTASLSNITTFNFKATAIGDTWLDEVFTTKRTVVLAGGSFSTLMGPIEFPAKTDILVEAEASADNTYVTSFYRLILVPV